MGSKKIQTRAGRAKAKAQRRDYRRAKQFARNAVSAMRAEIPHLSGFALRWQRIRQWMRRTLALPLSKFPIVCARCFAAWPHDIGRCPKCGSWGRI